MPSTSTAASGAAIYLTSASNQYQYITGTSSQVIVLPSTTLLNQSFVIVNLSNSIAIVDLSDFTIIQNIQCKKDSKKL